MLYTVLNAICCISITVLLVSLAIFVVILLCNFIGETISDWRDSYVYMRTRRHLSSLDDE